MLTPLCRGVTSVLPGGVDGDGRGAGGGGSRTRGEWGVQAANSGQRTANGRADRPRTVRDGEFAADIAHAFTRPARTRSTQNV